MIRVAWAAPLGPVYRDWLLDLAKIEANTGCPRLFRLKSDNAMYFADLTQHWSEERRSELLCARVKSLFNTNYGYARSELTTAERDAEAFWDYPFVGRDLGLGTFRTPSRPGVEVVRSSGGTKVIDVDKVGAVSRLDRLQSGDFKIDKSLLRRSVRIGMADRFGAPESSGAEWRFQSLRAGLNISTNVDFGGRAPSQLRYRQWVHTAGERRAWLLDHGGVSTLLGWPQTEWRYLTDRDIPEAVELLVRVCSEFVEAVPGMWERSGLAGAEAAPS